MNELGRVLDPSALDGAPGVRGRTKIAVPLSWQRGEIEILVPARIACARCDGGGCDDCGRSGAIRLPKGASARMVKLTLPNAVDPPCVVRLVRPFGDHADVDQLFVEIRSADEASPGCRLLRARAEDRAWPPERSGPDASEMIVLASIAFAVVAAIVVAIVR